MSNKNGDKVQGLGAPKVERNRKEEVATDYAEANVTKREEIVIPRPDSNFAQLPPVGYEEKAEVVADNPISSALDTYRVNLAEAKDESDLADAQLGLFRFLKGICNNPNHAEFRKDWTRLTSYLNRCEDIGLITLNKGVRFLNLDRGEQKAFSTLAFLIFTRCKNKVGYNDKPTSQVVDPNTASANLAILGNVAVDNILSFYNI